VKDNSVFDPLDDYIKSIKGRATTSFYPSSASCRTEKGLVGACLRKQYYDWKGVEGAPMTYRTYITFRLGSAYEHAFLEGYKARGLLKAADYPFRVTIMGLPISGRLDGLTKKDEVIECKSSYGKAFFYSVGNKPKPENLCQIMVYLAVLGLDVCILPYGSRDDQAHRQGYRLRKSDIENEGITFIGIIRRWKVLQAHLITDIPPDRDFEPGDWQCSYCGYRKICYSQPNPLDLTSSL
jgi:hypothetical protein